MLDAGFGIYFLFTIFFILQWLSLDPTENEMLVRMKNVRNIRTESLMIDDSFEFIPLQREEADKICTVRTVLSVWRIKCLPQSRNNFSRVCGSFLMSSSTAGSFPTK